MSQQKLKLVVDNTQVVAIQPFKRPVSVTRGDMKKLREGFDNWFEGKYKDE